MTQDSPNSHSDRVAASPVADQGRKAAADASHPGSEELRLRAELATVPPVETFALELDSVHRVLSSSGKSAQAQWNPPSHLRRYRPALFLRSGESLFLPPLNVRAGYVLRMLYAEGGEAGHERPCAIVVDLLAAEGSRQLLRAAVEGASGAAEPEIQVALISLPAGLNEPILLRVRCVGENRGAAPGGSVALLELAAGPADEIELITARAFLQLRIANERQHFSQAYDHPMYESRRKRTALGIDALIPSERSFAIPGAIENAFDYALAQLCRRLQHKAPDFEARLRKLAERPRRLSVLSICTGQGLVEAALFHSLQSPIELTIVDVGDELLQCAAANMPANVVVARRIVADANSLPALPAEFDIAICVSGVHHLVELREFFRRARDSLKASGELWLIGEQIVPNGNRLDKSALLRANQIFSRLPERLRLNYYTGRVDTVLINPDQSDATFEGIRSDALESELARFFVPRHVSRRDCILWRMVWPEYVVNYSLQRPEDVEILDGLVDEEITFFLSGGRPTELHGIYAPLRREAA